MPVLLCTTKYYASTTLYYTVLRQYYSVLQSTTPVLLCTTKYYNVLLQYYSVLQSTTLYYKVLASTTLYYKVLLQYYSVLPSTTTYYSVPQSTTPILLCTTKYYASTTLYYSSTTPTPVLQRTTLYHKVLRQYYSVLLSTKRHFQCREQGQAPCNLTKYCACHAKCKSSMICVTYATSFPLCGASKGTLQPHQILRWSASHMKRHFQSAEQQEAACNFTNCCACHTKWMSPVICHTYQTSFPMRGASEVTLQPHQMLRLPWEHECQQWCATHIKRHFQCAEQAKAACNLTKYCACHAKCKSSMICVTYATSFPLCGASKGTLQPHQILRLPRKMQVINDLRHIWNVISKVRSNKRQPATSPTAAPATQNECHQWSATHIKRHFQCAEQAKAPCNLTKYCACHAKCKSSMICVTYATSFPMRGASKGTLQPHQILRLPRKMQVINDLRHICNLISNARSKQRHPATSPNTAPATQNASHQWSASHMQPHFQCVEAVKLPSNLTKHCACHEILKLKISAETPWMLPPIERRFDDNPTTSDQIRRYPTISDDKIVISHPPLPRPYSSHFGRRFCIVKYNISRPGYLPKCHEVLRLSRKVTRQPHQILRLPQKVHYELCLYWSVTWLICYFTELLLYGTVTLRNCYFTDLLLYWTVTLLNCYFTELLLYWTVTLLNCFFTELLLYWTVTLLICYFTELLLYWTVTLLNCYLTDLLLYWTVTLLNCYFTELLLYWSVTLLNCYFTELLLYWSVTLLNCYFTELLLYWSVTLLICYFTELLLYWSITTLLICYFTELLLYWTVTLLNCYFTDLLLYWILSIFKSS